jgi:hypothetical protein
MKKVETITTLTCDLCGKEVTEFASVSEGYPVAVGLSVEVWYGGKKPYDLCRECNSKVLSLLRNIQKQAIGEEKF